jgi:MarR family transcriptional regulator, organic hydroperoxide resistance regulator
VRAGIFRPGCLGLAKISRTKGLTDQTNGNTLLVMFEAQIRRLFDAYPAIYLACHRRHVRDDPSGAIVTAHQASILDHLDAHKPTTLSKLAEHLGIGRSAMSIQVNQLAHRGYIRRSAVRGDGRKIGLTLTEAGNRVKRQNTVLDPDLVRAMFASMPESELATALEGIKRLAQYAGLMTRRSARRRNE